VHIVALNAKLFTCLLLMWQSINKALVTQKLFTKSHWVKTGNILENKTRHKVPDAALQMRRALS
jgi:hypothetical protein